MRAARFHPKIAHTQNFRACPTSQPRRCNPIPRSRHVCSRAEDPANFTTHPCYFVALLQGVRRRAEPGQTFSAPTALFRGWWLVGGCFLINGSNVVHQFWLKHYYKQYQSLSMMPHDVPSINWEQYTKCTMITTIGNGCCATVTVTVLTLLVLVLTVSFLKAAWGRHRFELTAFCTDWTPVCSTITDCGINNVLEFAAQ